MSNIPLCTMMLLAAAVGFAFPARSEPLGVGTVSDARFQAAPDTDFVYDLSYFATKYDSAEAWKTRADALRQQVLASAGLLPFPDKTPLHPVVFGSLDRGDYIVEKVYLQSYPGVFVTGNLYRPKGEGPFPGVLNPHGHWNAGRLEDSSDCSVAGRCINFAKQGYVAFSYDMVGFVDAKQISHSLSGRRENLWGISLGGLQTWNSIRALDFLESLPYVDKSRIACTGASGGGTQTFLLSAIDDRVKVCAPVNMISVSMQGGCGCENMPNLRIDTNNVELGALMAPRPMIMIAATGDWTKDTPKAEYPATRHIYSLFGATDKVTSVQMDAGHNYNKDSREAVYSWFARHLPKKPSSKPVKEQPFEVEKPEDLRVFPDDKRPEGALDKDGIVNMLIERSKAQLEECRPVDRGILNRLRKSYEPALRHALALYAKPSVQVDLRGEEDRGGYKLTRLVIKDVSRGAQIPALLFIPNNEQGNAVLMVNRAGKLACLDRSGENPGALASYLIDKGCSVLAIDCFGIGENGAPEGARRLEPKLKFFETFNRADTAERVYDILVALEYLASGPGSKSTHLVGIGEAGLWSLLARPFSSRVSRTIVDAVGFDTSNDESYLKQLYVPCLRRAGDLSTAMALSAPGDLLIHNTQGTFDASWAKDAYAAAGKSDRLRVLEGKTSDIELARWLAIEN